MKTAHPLYKTYTCMIERCYNPASRNYPQYGGRGITVCKKWRESFNAFLADLGEKPSPHHSIDRINNSKGYSPSNCRWATAKDQARNRRTNKLVTWNGVTKCISEWAEELNRCPSYLRKALVDSDWDMDKALLLKRKIQKERLVIHEGERKTLTQLSKDTGIKYRILHSRIFKHGWSVERAVAQDIRPARRRG